MKILSAFLTVLHPGYICGCCNDCNYHIKNWQAWKRQGFAVFCVAEIGHRPEYGKEADSLGKSLILAMGMYKSVFAEWYWEITRC